MDIIYKANPHWEVQRSRNKGQTWSNLTNGMNLSRVAAYIFADKESEKHPSDWLRVVRVEHIVERGYNCYGHCNVESKNEKNSPLTPIRKLKEPIDIKRFNEVCQQSLGGLQTFKGNGE